MKEVWKDITGYEGLYQVSNTGKVRSLNYLNTGEIRELKQAFLKGNYRTVNLYKNRIPCKYTVHSLVAKHFIPNPKNLPIVMHKKENLPIEELHSVDNLQWGTSKDNVQDMILKDRAVINYGTNHGKSIITENDVTAIRTLHQETGEGRRKISRKLGLPLAAVGEVLRGKTWKHIK